MQNKSFQTILFSTVGIVVMAVLLIIVNLVTGQLRARIDLTKEKAYTLSPGTKAILKKLDAPVKIRFYVSQTETATPETVYLRDYARRVEDLLAEWRATDSWLRSSIPNRIQMRKTARGWMAWRAKTCRTARNFISE